MEAPVGYRWPREDDLRVNADVYRWWPDPSYAPPGKDNPDRGWVHSVDPANHKLEATFFNPPPPSGARAYTVVKRLPIAKTYVFRSDTCEMLGLEAGRVRLLALQPEDWE